MPTVAAESDIVLARARRGDLEAVEALFREHSKSVFHLARKMCRSAQDAEDIVQETFVEVARSISRYRGDGPLAAWIHRVAASKALMHLRKARLLGTTEAYEDESLAGAPPPHPTAKLDLGAAFSRLSPASRAVVWLHDVEGYTHEEIASMMGLTPSFSKSRLARGHARLKEILGLREKDHASGS